MKTFFGVLKIIGITLVFLVAIVVIAFLSVFLENTRGDVISSENDLVLRGNEELAMNIRYQGLSGDNIRIDRKYSSGIAKSNVDTEYVPIIDGKATFLIFWTKLEFNNIRKNNDGSITVDLVRKYGKYSQE